MTEGHQRVEALYRKFGQLTYQRVLRRLGDQEVAQDVTQDVFKSLLSVADRLEDSERTHRYLFRTTTNAICRVLRHRYRAATLDRALLVEQSEWQEQRDDWLEQRVAQLELRTLEGQLTKEEWELLVYRIVEELPVIEIAAIFGISDRAIRKRWTRLQDKLRGLQDAALHVASKEKGR
jgi:RNA polymerase sigma-70 factor (ECF subfamily)